MLDNKVSVSLCFMGGLEWILQDWSGVDSDKGLGLDVEGEGRKGEL